MPRRYGYGDRPGHALLKYLVLWPSVTVLCWALELPAMLRYQWWGLRDEVVFWVGYWLSSYGLDGSM